MKYQNIIVDTVNLAYRTFKTKEELPQRVGQKEVYKDSVRAFIKQMRSLEKTYLEEGGQIYFLIDNYYSKADLQSVFSYLTRKELDESYKATRKKENREFYNSINLVRYYYLHMPSHFHTARIETLEADDLVKPLLEQYCKGQTALMVTTDMDWTRYLSDKVHWLPRFQDPPESASDLEAKIGFPVTETNIITYKAVFGDASDNIKGVARETKENIGEFLELISRINEPEDILWLAKSSHAEKGLLSEVYQNEPQFLINETLVSNIPLNPGHLRAVLTTGRDVKVMVDALEEILELNGRKKFKFGNIKRPRVEGPATELPKEDE